MKQAKFVCEVTVTDPDTNSPVQVSLFKNTTSGFMFGVDATYLDQCFDEDEDINVPDIGLSDSNVFSKKHCVQLTGI